MGTVRILCFFLVLRNFWVGTVKKSTLYVKSVFPQINLLTGLSWTERKKRVPSPKRSQRKRRKAAAASRVARLTILVNLNLIQTLL